ncbi:MAG: hypothetical protein DI535_04640 [Citrobacter freundii]|nr:MAG: hypothetical protein DI535_04640 [Citrobacter freundii]
MKHNTAPALRHPAAMPLTGKPSLFSGINAWIKSKTPFFEENRLGITATGIFLQVTAAAVMICLAGMSGASPFAFGAGILFAFLADSLVLAQASMKWVIGTIGASILINLGLAVYFASLLV